ncbi:MAG: phosphoglycerate kinase [bacterium]|nr:phosphoglycerate kinase [bacterium]
MKLLKDLDLKGKRVLYRVDINSSIMNGKLADDDRIRAILPTVKRILSRGAKQIIFLAHQGRSKERGPDTVLDLHAKHLGELLGKEVLKLDSCRDVKIPEKAQLVMLENVRLDDEASDDSGKREAFARVLAGYGDVYVNDAFAACHRDHASISFLPKLMKEKGAGLLLQREIEALDPLLKGKMKKPFTVIIGGAKIDTKIGLIEQFIDKGARFLLGGGIANTFLAAEGYDVGESLQEKTQYDVARDVAMRLDAESHRLFLPKDVVCADEAGDHVTTMDIPIDDVMGDMKIFDIGERAIQGYVNLIRDSETILWNGPVGLTEYQPFRKGSEAIARAMVKSGATTIVGGGESVALINSMGLSHHQFTHVSTGGGAMLEFLGGKKLPGIMALET